MDAADNQRWDSQSHLVEYLFREASKYIIQQPTSNIYSLANYFIAFQARCNSPRLPTKY
jgi:hypothetical protein